MGLFSGLAMIAAAFAADVPGRLRQDAAAEFRKNDACPECAEVIKRIYYTHRDRKGRSLYDYKYYGDLFWRDINGGTKSYNKAVYDVAQRECRELGIRWSMTEASAYCPCTDTYEYFRRLGIYK